MKHLSVLVLSLVVLQPGCGAKTSGGGTNDGGPIDAGAELAGLTSIVVTPATANVTVQNGTVATTSFTATGHFSDGHTADVTALAAWSLVDPGIGTIAAGSFTSVATRGGKTTVTVSGGTATASAQLTVKWTATRASTDDGSTAPDASATFASATGTDATLAPTVAYPLDGVIVPVNLGELEVQWLKPAGAADLYEVALTADTLDLRIYTNAPETTGGRLSLSAAEWAAISGSVAGSDLTIQVTGMASADTTKKGAAGAVTLTMDSQSVNGGIYYWTPTNQGIERHEFGDTTGLATPFYDVTSSGGHCVACHVVSRDGKKAVVTFDSAASGNSAVLDVATVTQTIPESAGLLFDFATFSPDGSKIVAAHQTGALTIYDSTSGAVLGTAASTAGAYYSQPDWSPDGKSLVYVQATGRVDADWQFIGGSILVATGPGDGTFGTPKVIVASNGTDNNYYPSFSPDGKWILYNHAATDVSYNNVGASLSVVSTDGTLGPIVLANANATGSLTNSWPRWSPFVQMYADGSTRLYFTFSSKRNYGIELEQPADATMQRPQIWMSSFEPAKAILNGDPSAAPFWLPFQDITTNNHIAQWTTEVVGLQ